MDIDDLKDLDEETWKEVEALKRITIEKHGKEAFGAAQFHIGMIFSENGKRQDAILILSDVERKDNLEAYAKSQLNIGRLHFENDNIQDALKFWNGIKLEDNSEVYAEALFEIGKCAFLKEDLKLEDLDESIKVWTQIKRSYSLAAYTNAQYAIIIFLSLKGDLETALTVIENITYSDSPENYARANYFLGTRLIESKPYSSSYKFVPIFDKSIGFFPYESSCYSKICDLSFKIETQVIGQFLLQLFKKVLAIVENLKIDFSQASNEEHAPERKLAHYTSVPTTDLLLKVDKDNRLPSSFRLNTVNNVNDPSEGQLLINYLQGIEETLFSSSILDEELHTFISCFTFNHDSLNQFRLYGKYDNKEASGVSLVFQKDFFQKQNFKDGLSFLQTRHISQNFEKNLTIKVEKIDQQPVMRCVYLDPTSGYIQLAQRNRITFFREFNDQNLVIEGIETSKAEHEWSKYENYINNKTEGFKDLFLSLKIVYKSIIEENIKIKRADLKSSNDIQTLLDEILLPLRYLIKHSAFQEEQECRMVYITSLKDSKVKMDFGKFLYVEYESEVKLHLDKIYIAPAATQYQPYLAKLLCDTNVKIELSNNPYRQT